jgi:glucuronate isomerase
MKKFMDGDFLLDTKTARNLYHNCAAHQPIYDYHCHLNPAQIAENKQFDNLSEIWLGGDHYKWRQMRTFGIDEAYITGTAAPYDKFLAWAGTVENLPGNPLYHWTHLELQRYFDIHEPLTKKSAPAIWAAANKMLKTDALSVRGIFETFKVHTVGTTDDPVDSLEHHSAIAAGSAPVGTLRCRVIPSFRPDKALNIRQAGFKDYMTSLASVSGIELNSVDAVIQALIRRLDYFITLGCRAADHALEYPPFVAASDSAVEASYAKALSGAELSPAEADAWKTRVLSALAAAYAERGIVMQLHLAALRNTKRRSFAALGPDSGFDAVHDHQLSENLAALLSHIDESSAQGLPKTVLYTLNPKDYYPLGTLTGCFQGGPVKTADGKTLAGLPGKIQLGSAWWFADHKDGMEEQLRVLGNLGMLPVFIGMLTDSRSFLSYPRHEYFRRILCKLLGTWVENGEFPADVDKLFEIVQNVSFHNAERYFN